MKLRRRFLALAAPLALTAACGASDSDGLFNPTGGARSTGGASSGGSATSGGTGTTSGGSSPTGGSSPSGGGAGQGGTVTGGVGGSTGGAAGGSAGIGGASGSPSSGGAPGTGGGSNGGATTGGVAGAASGGSSTGGDASSGAAGLGGVGGGSDAGGQGGSGGSDGCDPRAKEICDGLDNDCNGKVDNGLGVCPSGCEGVEIDGRGYMFCLQAMSRNAAGAGTVCAAQDMHLVWLDSAEENAAVLAEAEQLSNSVQSFWIGATDAGLTMEGEWRWVAPGESTGTPFWSGQSPQSGGKAVGGAYANWGSMRPDHGQGEEDCVAMILGRDDLRAGSWDDESCTMQARFVCESF